MISLYTKLVAILSTNLETKQLILILIEEIQVLILRTNFEIAKKALLIVFYSLYYKISKNAS